MNHSSLQKGLDPNVWKRVLNQKAIHSFSPEMLSVPGGRVLTWIENWLADRKQRAGVNGSFSEWQTVASGVPQGSVLGPQLFAIYINDLEEGIKSNTSTFADDIKLGGSVNCEEDVRRLQGDLERLNVWADVWQMQYNIDKCEVIHFGAKNKGADYYLNGG